MMHMVGLLFSKACHFAKVTPERGDGGTHHAAIQHSRPQILTAGPRGRFCHRLPVIQSFVYQPCDVPMKLVRTKCCSSSATMTAVAMNQKVRQQSSH